METNANYVAVGAFVLASLLGLVVALLWLVGMQYSQEFAYYQTYFRGAVTGLGDGTPVRYNGIAVGRVSKLKFDPEDPKRVIVVMAVDPALKIHEDSVASIASTGLTGSSYVEIDGGSKNSPLVARQPDQEYPVIKSAPSTLQQLEESAPMLIAKYNRIGDQLTELLNEKNLVATSEILANLKTTTGVLAKRSGDLDETIRNLDLASRGLTGDLDRLRTTLDHADEAMTNIAKLSHDADSIASGDTAAQVSELVTQARAMVASLRTLSDNLKRQPTALFFGDRREGYTPK